MKRLAPLLALALLIGGGYAVAQVDFPTAQSNVNSRGSVTQCLNTAGVAVASTGQLPCGAIATAASSTGTTGVVSATLPAAANKTTYLCSVQIGEAGSGTATATATNTTGATLNYLVVAPGNFTVTYNPCLPANSPSTAIPVATAANATATAVAISITGFQL